MAYRIHPISAFAATESKVFPRVIRTDTNSFWVEGLGVMASLDSDAELHYVFHVPTSLPSGNAKLELISFAENGGGNAKVNPKWKSVDFGETMDLASGSLNAEGTETITWTYNSDQFEMKRTKVTLDADTVVADEFIQLSLVMETTNWTMNDVTIWLPSIIWE